MSAQVFRYSLALMATRLLKAKNAGHDHVWLHFSGDGTYSVMSECIEGPWLGIIEVDLTGKGTMRAAGMHARVAINQLVDHVAAFPPALPVLIHYVTVPRSF
jgi:hypothetical protein